MKKNLILLCVFLSFVSIYAQEREVKQRGGLSRQEIKEQTFRNDSVKKAKQKKQKDYDIKLYKISTHDRDTMYFDTSLTIEKEYKYNYLRRDNFELMPFANIGQTYNTLGHNYNRVNAFPKLGSRAKHFNYHEVEDVQYFNVPTPTSELFFKTTFEQGQLLDAFITMNTSKRLNFSIAYKGMRSLGKYQNILSSTGNFRFTTNYKTANDRYYLRAHFYSQDILNQENGGLTEQAVSDFEEGVDEFTDRSRISVNFENAEGIMIGKRYYLEHDYKLLRKKDSVHDSNLRIGHTFNYETKFYRYEQTAANDFFGDAFVGTSVRDQSQLRTMFNQASLSYTTKAFGDVKFKANHYHYNYFFNSILYTADDTVVPSGISGDEISIGGEWKHTLAGIKLKADVLANISGDLGGSYFRGSGSYDINDDINVQAAINVSSKLPNFNFLLYQSDYIDYNWRNQMKKENTQNIHLEFNSKKWVTVSADFTSMDNHAYFSKLNDAAQVTPQQASESITYLKLKASKEFKYRKFALNNTVMYQNVTQSGDVFNVPQLVTRNTLYYSDKIFKKALFFQTGITLNYFSEYNANGYSPLLAEFYSQNSKKIGNFPRLDFFINAKVRRTRIYLKAEHFNSSFTGYNFYSAPENPYRDFVIRFGLVWNFFS